MVEKKHQPCCWDRFECEKFCYENVSRHCVLNVWIGVSFTIRCTSTWAVLHYKLHDNETMLQMEMEEEVWGMQYLHLLEMMFRYILHQSVSHSRMHLFSIQVSHFLPADEIEFCVISFRMHMKNERNSRTKSIRDSMIVWKFCPFLLSCILDVCLLVYLSFSAEHHWFEIYETTNWMRYLPVIVKWQPNHHVNPIGCQSVQLVYAFYGKLAPIFRVPQQMCQVWWRRSTAKIRHYPDSISDVMDRENLDLRYRPTPLSRDSHRPSLQLKVNQNNVINALSYTMPSYEIHFTFHISFVSSALVPERTY